MTELPVTLHQRPATLLDQARWLYHHRPDHPVVTLIEHDSEQTITYREFFTHAARYAHALEKSGVRPGDLVALILQHGDSVLYGFWGAMLLGAVPSIFAFLTEKLDRTRYFDNVRQLIDYSDVRVVITYTELEPELHKHLDGITSLAAIINSETLQPGGDIEHYLSLNPAQPEDTAFLQHSSGSTGLQKGVMLSHRAVLNQIASCSDAIRLQPDDIIVSWLPLYHDMGLIAGFIMPILQGIHLVLMSPFHWVRDPKLLLHAIHRHQGTICWLPNFAFNFLATRVRDADIEGIDLSCWRAAINCSEPVHAASHQQFLEKFASYGFQESAFATSYGMAENVFAATQGGIDAPLTVDVVNRQKIMDERRAVPADGEGAEQTFVSCGKPIANCTLRVVDESRQPLPERHVGEFIIKSNCMLSGYYKRPELTAEVLHDGWYFTGDMGYVANGEVYVTGRKKDLIIVGGKNVYPQDIENLLNDIPGLHAGRATAFGIFNDRLGTEDVAIVAEVRENEVSLDDKEILGQITREIRARIAQNTDVTARYVHLVGSKWLIKTSSGKIARRANRDKFMQDVLHQNGS